LRRGKATPHIRRQSRGPAAEFFKGYIAARPCLGGKAVAQPLDSLRDTLRQGHASAAKPGAGAEFFKGYIAAGKATHSHQAA